MNITIPRTVIALAVTLGLGGCATRPFARVAGPAQSQVAAVALAGQTCSRENDPNWSTADVLGLDLRIRVDNTGASPLSFDPAQVALLAAGQFYRPHRSDAAEVLLPGTSRTLVVHFWERNGDLACNVPMALALDRAVTVGGSAVALAPISFLASHDDT
jgi:uncharacterized protein YceK